MQSDAFDEFAWIEEQEKGVRQSIENLQAEIAAYQRQLASLRAQRVRVELCASRQETLMPAGLR